MIDNVYCMNSFLMFRRVYDETKSFAGIDLNSPKLDFERYPIKTSVELEEKLKNVVESATRDGKAALALSGGIDSAILAKFMPKGSVAYTFKCVVPGVKVTDETETAAKYARECGLEHRVIGIYWEDFEKYAAMLMKHKGEPIHSIEVQIYKASLRAKEDGFERLIYGESADSVFGGLSNLLSKSWRIGEFIDRYSFVPAHKVLKNYCPVFEPYIRHVKDGFIDPHEFISTEFFPESVGSYINASEVAGIELVIPYSYFYLASAIDYDRIIKGENKYLVREVFNRLYTNFEVPPKIPMPRPTNEWFKDWKGPTRPEFWPHCTDEMSGDQKWLVWALERFLNVVEQNGKE